MNRTTMQESAQRLLNLLTNDAPTMIVMDELQTLVAAADPDGTEDTVTHRVDVDIRIDDDGITVEEATGMTMLFINWVESDPSRHSLIPKDRPLGYRDMQRIMAENGG